MKTIMEIFKEKVKKNGEKPAIFFQNTSLSYKEFDDLSDKLAEHLVEEGVKENDIIPMLCKPSIERMIGIFAILKAGAAYLPIPVDSSEERIKYLVEDSGTNFLVCDQESIEFQGVKCLDIKKLNFYNKKTADAKIRIGEIAYVIYTSGSTGKPKGVKVSHKNLMYVLNNMQKYYPIIPEDRYLLNTPYSFDVSVVEIFGWILGDGALVVSELETKKKFIELIKLVDKYNITHISLSPSVLRLIYNICGKKEIEIINKNLKFLMFAGEEFQFELAKKALESFKDVKIFNLYGPTEATVYATRYDVDNKILEKKYVPIGVPLDGADIKIMDKNGHEVKNGEEGEIYIFGDGVVLGYHNNKALNDKKFGKDSRGIKFYRSGDIGNINEDGNIKFLGRNDNQVQIHGIRVELGEIENVLLKIKEVQGACVVYENKQLIAFIEGNEKLEIEEIKKKLSDFLPNYMVPRKMLILKEFPMSTNRKVDRKKLLSLLMKKSSLKKQVFEGISLIICKLINKVLNVEVENSKEDFFELGGDSLDGIHLINLIEKEFNIELRDDFLYSHSTINSICEYITQIQNEAKESIIRDGGDISSVIDRKALYQELSTSYKKNSEHMRSGQLKEYDSFFYQRVYRNIRFDSKIGVEIFIDKKVSIQEIEIVVKKLIKTNSVFRSLLKEKDRGIVFIENLNFDRYILGKYELKDYRAADHNKFEDIISEELNKSIKIYNDQYLLYNMILIEYKDGYMLQLALDHNIADLSCVHILKKKFNDILKGKNVNHGIDYHGFIQITNKNNEKNLLAHQYTIKVNEANKCVDKNKLNEFDDGILVLRKPIKYVTNNEWYINQSSYLVGQIGCDIFESASVCINAILNLRKLKGMDITELVGDVHTVGTMIVNKEDSVDDYKRYLKDEFDKFYIDDGKNPMHIIYKNLPVKENYQKQLEKVYVSDVPINLNYVGQIKENEVEDFYLNLKKMKIKLDKFEVKMLKTTVVSTEKNLYIFILKKPEIKDKILKKFGIENIEIVTES